MSPRLNARERDVVQDRGQPKRDDRLNVGGEEPQTGNYFVSAYPPFSCWSAERVPAVGHVLGVCPSPSEPDVPLGLYVHIPFCVKRCAYCYYLSYADRSAAQINAYLDAVRLELSLYRKSVALAGRACSFVYIGGGTPSLLSPRQILRLLGDINETFPAIPGREVTFECAPQTVTPDKLDAMRAGGVTRVSLGVQQLNDEVLRRNGRVHLERDVERAYAAIRHVGFDVVNMDLMVGLVGETQDTFDASLERVIAMDPESVTLYPLEIPRNTPLYRALRSGELEGDPASWTVKRSRMASGFARLEQAGYTVRSAYAAVRDPQRHWFVYQDAQYHGADLIGLGVASFSYLAGVHYQNIANLDAYQARLADNELPIARAYALNDDERIVRAFVLQLKLGAVSFGNERRTCGVDVRKRFAASLREVTQLGWAHVDDDAVTLTREGLMHVDRMSDRLAGAERRGPVRGIRELAYRNTQVCGDGWVMIGDAAAFLDPIYSSGLFLAMGSAEMAADAVHDALDADDVSSARLGTFAPPLSAGIEVIRRLIHGFYDTSFSFRAFTKRFPDQRTALIDCLVGDVVNRDMTAFLDALAQMTPPPPPFDTPVERSAIHSM